MCHPAIGNAFNAVAAYQQGRMNREVARYNSRVAINAANETRSQARTAESEERQRAAEFVSSQRAALASRGVSVEEGSALTMQEDTRLIGEVNAMRIRETAEDRAKALEAEARLSRAQGRAAMQAGIFGAGAAVGKGASDIVGSIQEKSTPEKTTVLGESSSGGTVANKWYASRDRYNLGYNKYSFAR